MIAHSERNVGSEIRWIWSWELLKEQFVYGLWIWGNELIIEYSCSVTQTRSTLDEPGNLGFSCDIVWHKSMYPGRSCDSCSHYLVLFG